jgi:hypothetical protein
MRIIKPHNKEQQEFDEFMKQRLDAAEVDMSAMEKYMQAMSFPVINDPVVPQKKNDTWKKGLLVFILLFLSYMGYYVGKSNRDSVNNKTGQPGGENATINETAVKKQSFKKSETQPLPEIGEAAAKKETVHTEAYKNAKPALKHFKQHPLCNTGDASAPFLYSGKDSANLPAIKIITKPLEELPASQVKKPTADSLYIIW